MQYIKIFFLTGIMVLVSGISLSYAHASDSSVQIDTAKNNRISVGQLASLAGKSKKNTRVQMEELDKTIANVKVFYNPVAEQIAVSFKLAKNSHVTIKVMDALGNEVMGLLNEDLDEGTQSLSFETNGKLQPGFYFVRVTSGSESVIKRISIR